MKKFILTMAAIIITQNVAAGSATKDNVRFFEHFMTDAARSAEIYVEGNGAYGKYDDIDLDFMGFGIQGGIPLAPDIEVGFDGGWASLDPKVGDNQSGLVDIGVTGKYHVPTTGSNKITIGASLTLPVGDEDIGQGNTNFGFFGAIRHPVNARAAVMGIAGLNFDEQGDDDRETSFHLGGGAIYQMDNQLHLVGEFALETEGDIMAITGGVDYALQSNGRFRGAISLGLDDGSPDFLVQAGYLMRF